MLDLKNINRNPKSSLLFRVWAIFTVIIIISLFFYAFYGFGQISSMIYRINGEVTAFNPDSGVWETAKTGQLLSANLRIKTGTKSWVEVRLDDGSLLRIGENTEVKVITIYINPMMGIRTARWSLQGSGNVYVNTGESGSVYDIITPNFTASALSGTMRVDGDELGNYEVKVSETNGQAIIDLGKIIKPIESGKSAKVDAESKLTMSESITDEQDAWNQNLNNPDLELKFDTVTSQQNTSIIGYTNPEISIWVNNKEATTANKEGQFIFNVELKMGKNAFELTAKDKQNRETKKTAHIERIKTDEHQIIIISPVEGSVIDENKVSLSGIAVGSEKVLVNNSLVRLTKTQFTTVVNLEPGDNKIDIVSYNKDGQRIEKQLYIKRGESHAKATLSILSPQNGIDIREDKVTIIGATNAIKVVINSLVAKVAGGRFEQSMPLEYGKNIFVVRTSDTSYKEASQTLIVHRPKPNATIPKLVNISYPSLVNKPDVQISGWVKDAITLSIDKKNITFGKSDGYFSEKLNLKEGVNKITVEAISADGGVSSQTISIICDMTPPDLSRLKSIRILGKDGIAVVGQIEHGVKRIIVNNTAVPSTDITLGTNGGLDSISYNILSYTGNAVVVRAEDAAGNISERVIKIETTNP